MPTPLTAKLLSIQVGLPRLVGAQGDPARAWRTGMFKEPVAGPVRLGPGGLDGDGQADLEHHGGPDKAVNAYCAEHYPRWEAELGIGPLGPGAFGENFTLTGLLEDAVCIGDVFAAGEARLQVSQPRQPCEKLPRRWQRDDLAWRVRQTGRTGWYFRVLVAGTVEAGLPLALVGRPHPDWPVSLANEVMHQRPGDIVAARELAACPALSASWRRRLAQRAGEA